MSREINTTYANHTRLDYGPFTTDGEVIAANDANGVKDTIVGANRYTCVQRDSHTWDIRGHRYVLIAVTQAVAGTDITEVADLEYKLI